MKFEEQLEQIKKIFSLCETKKERLSVFLMFATDMSYYRGAICRALKELEINNDMTLTKSHIELFEG